MIFGGIIPDGLDPISVYRRQLDWALHGIPTGAVDPGLAMATIAYGILYMFIILGIPFLLFLGYELWKEIKAYMKEIQVREGTEWG